MSSRLSLLSPALRGPYPRPVSGLSCPGVTRCGLCLALTEHEVLRSVYTAMCHFAPLVAVTLQAVTLQVRAAFSACPAATVPLSRPLVPKAQSDKCVPDRDPRWQVLDSTKKAVASLRVVFLAKPKVRKDLNEGYDPFRVSPASLVAQASPRLYELATPKSITKKV